MTEQPRSILLVGCGRMGRAFVAGWAGSATVFVHDPHVGEVPGTTRLSSLDEVAGLPRPLTVMLAVKPKLVREVARALRPFVSPDMLVVSIAAGVTLDTLADLLGPEPAIVRAMPNTPVAVGRGAIAAVTAGTAGQPERARVEALFAAAGTLVWLGDEAQMDAVTALSGSGPAYFFRFAEVLADAGVSLGLDRTVADALARATLVGSGMLADSVPASLAAMREEVTSPGGTTAAALARLEEGGLPALVRDAAAAAHNRSRELAREASA